MATGDAARGIYFYTRGRRESIAECPNLARWPHESRDCRFSSCGNVTRTTPLATLGDPNWWGDYAVSVDARVDEAPHVDGLGRVDGVQLGEGGQPGYRLRLARDGRWTLIEYASDRVETTLADGRIPAYEPGQWHRLGMAFRGSRITAYIDNRRVASVRDTKHNRGQGGVMVGDWSRAQFDDLTVTPTGRAPVLLPQGELTATATPLPAYPIRYVRLEAHEGNGYAGAAELNVTLPTCLCATKRRANGAPHRTGRSVS